MNKKIGLLTALAFSLVFGQTAFAADTTSVAAQSTATDQQSTKPCACGCGERTKKIVEALKLDDAQKTKIKAIKEQTKASEKANWEQMKALRVQTNQLIQSDNIDQTKLDSLVNQKKELFATMMKAKIMAKHQIYNVLNEQQKTQYQQMIKQWETNAMMDHKKC